MTALRAHRRLLAPEEIRAGIERVNMTQEEVADQLGIARATLSHDRLSAGCRHSRR